MEKHVGTALGALIVSFCLGTFAMIYNSDKNNEVFKAQLTFIAQRVSVIELDIKQLEATINAESKNRWTREDQNVFSKNLDKKFERIWDRVNVIETKVDRLEGNGPGR